MTRWRLGCAVLLCSMALAFAAPGGDDTPEPTLPADRGPPAADGVAVAGAADTAAAPAVPGAPRYWRVRMQMTLGAADRPKQARMYLPTSSARQTIFERTVWGEPLGYRETASGENLLGQWYAEKPLVGAQTVTADYTVRIAGNGQSFPLSVTERANLDEYRAASATIPAESPAVQRHSVELVRPLRDPRAQAIACAQFVATAIAAADDAGPATADAALQARRATPLGMARLLAALLRAAHIPARVVGGVVLDAVAQPAQYTYWVEAAVPGSFPDPDGVRTWIELDPVRRVFGSVSNAHLVLFRGDHPLIRHSANLDFSYAVKVQRLTPDEAIAELTDNHASQFARVNADVARSNAAAVTNPVATILWVTDQVLPATLTDKFVAAASAQRVKVLFLTAPYGSRLFRAEHMTELMQRYDRTLRQADAVVLHTRDDAGFYALLAQGGRSGLLKHKIVYVTGALWSHVGDFLGRSVMTLFRPRALVVIPAALDANAMWDVVTTNFLDGVPIDDVARSWKLPLMQFSEATVPLGRWRQFLLDTWIVAAREGVTPQSLMLVLIIPLIALLVVIYRGVFGFQSFGTFAPVILCVAFLRTGVWWGVALFATILGVGALLRSVVNHWRLFMAARMALLLGIIGLLMLVVGVVGIWLGLGPLVNISVFPMVIMAGVIEQFTRAQVESGWAAAVRMAAATLGLCIACYCVLDWLSLQSVVLVYPEVVLGGIACTILLGRWRGLRLVELIRFYRLGRHHA